MILIRVVRCMMPGRGLGGRGASPWEVKAALETPRSNILSEAKALPLCLGWGAREALVRLGPLSVYWVPAALESHPTLSSKISSASGAAGRTEVRPQEVLPNFPKDVGRQENGREQAFKMSPSSQFK